MSSDTIAYQLKEMRDAAARAPFEGGCWFFLSHQQMEALLRGEVPDDVREIARQMLMPINDYLCQLNADRPPAPTSTKRRIAKRR